ncbi:hypothetical protein JXM83_04865 [Candidatus Woesearchaeota archaeon]|nr:hypothetical protein [Candidatus Woesearchaeota archaeon]
MAEKKKDEKPKEPSIFDILEKEHKKGDEYINTVDFIYDEASVNARRKFLDKYKSFDKLNDALDNDPSAADAFADEIVGHFLKFGKERYGWNLDNASGAEKDRIVHFLAGVSKSELKSYVNQYGSGYHEIHGRLKGQHINTLRKSHHSALSEHVSGGNIEQIVNKLGIDIDADKMKLMKENPDQYRERLIEGYVENIQHKKSLKKMYK